MGNFGKGLLDIAAQLGILDMFSSAPHKEIKLLLSEYGSQPGDKIAPELNSKLKNYLKTLNATSQAPLEFRIEVMELLKDYLEIIDNSLLPEVFKAYKITFEILYKPALEDQNLVPFEVELAAIAMTLATRMLRNRVHQYRRPSLTEVNETLSLARMSLQLIGNFEREEVNGFPVLRQQFALHEIIRSMETKAMTVKNQHTVLSTIQEKMHDDHLIDVRLISANAHIEFHGFTLLTNLQKPFLLPRKSLRVAEVPDEDMILCELDLLVTRLIDEMKSAQTFLGKSNYNDEYAFHNEKLNNAMLAGLAIVDMMRVKKRRHERAPHSPPIYIRIEKDVEQVMQALANHKKTVPLLAKHSNKNQPNIWQVVDISRGGYCLEKIHLDVETGEESNYLEVNRLVSISTVTHIENGPGSTGWKVLDHALGTVCWYEQNESSHSRIGIAKLIDGEVAHAVITKTLLSSDPQGNFDVFVENIAENRLGIWVVGVELARGSSIKIHSADGDKLGKIDIPIQQGVNHTVYGCDLE